MARAGCRAASKSSASSAAAGRAFLPVMVHEGLGRHPAPAALRPSAACEAYRGVLESRGRSGNAGVSVPSGNAAPGQPTRTGRAPHVQPLLHVRRV